jgi:hypothetical protein
MAVPYNASQALKDFISKNPTIRPDRTSGAYKQDDEGGR